jgi:23S rRNA (adenine2503-C2)-methyltransferase
MRDTVPKTEARPLRADIAELDRPALEAALAARGHERFRARQIFGWVYRRGVADLNAMTDLSRDLRATLAADFTLSTPAIAARERSVDGTEKFLFRLADGRQIESVFIPDTPGMTLCISTQVGCAMACAFCLTGKMGLLRNLTAGEIAGQVRVLAGALDFRDKAFNIVLMGMGEPLHNYDETMKALRILADEHGLALPPRRVTLSTVGLLPALERLAHETVMPNLAISLHAPEDARRLAKLLAGVKSKVNLIPLNAAAGIPFERPSDGAIDRFAKILAERSLTVSVRKSRGRDIRAACGQLIVEGQRKSPGQQLATLAFTPHR